jgi:hypothetical protein
MPQTRRNSTPIVLLLAGASETARAVLVENLLDRHKDWRHLALEDLREDGEWKLHDDVEMDEVFSALLACECAKEFHEEGHPIVVTCPALSLLDTVTEALPDPLVSVYMGTVDEAPESGFDHIIDSSSLSARAACQKLERIIGKR